MTRPPRWVLAACCLLLQARAAAGLAVWIDTDPACGLSPTVDVDDCWALKMALESRELEIRGISSVFGNAPGAATGRKAREIVARLAGPAAPPVFRGSARRMGAGTDRATPADIALAAALEREPLTILALGPLTNVARLIRDEPRLAGRIRQVIAVAGKRRDAGAVFRPGSAGLLHLHDFNFRKDVRAFEVVLEAAIPLVLIPYELASRLAIGPADLERLAARENARWLADLSRDWLAFWTDGLEAPGFFPFDSFAVAYAIDPAEFACETVPARVVRRRSLFVASRDDLLVSHDYAGRPRVRYCFDLGANRGTAGLKERMFR